MAQYGWSVIGAGPAGIAAVGKLLDHGVSGNDIVWLDPAFGAGDFAAKWAAVPGNTPVSQFLEYLHGSSAFQFAAGPPFALNEIDPAQTCPLGVVADPLLWISRHLRDRVVSRQTVATELSLDKRCWTVHTERETITAKNVILAVGADPKKLCYPGLREIPLDTALDPRKLARIPLHEATVAVFGGSHSTMIALPNLLSTPVRKVINFYRSPLKYAVCYRNWTLFDDTGLKGQAASWARENIDGTWPDRLERHCVLSPDFDEQLRTCDHVVYTIGFERRQSIATPQWGHLDYNTANGILAPGLFGIGIAYPEYRTDPLESGHYRIGLLKFMQRLKTVIPLWLRYST